MATLGSPGVQVSVIDESFYTPAAPGTVPLIFVATAQDKSNAAGTGTAQGTTAANAGKVYVITSQRDLTDTFGSPKFYADASGNPIHGSELNEYGLQAAYSVLGVSSRAYIVRADLDLAALEPKATAPTGAPIGGQYWVDTANSLFGINEWDKTTEKFTVKTVKMIDDSNIDTDADGSMVPKTSFGSQGDYAMVVTADNSNTLYYKKSNNVWIAVTEGFDGGKSLRIAPHTSYPDFTPAGIDADTGSVWVKTTTPGYGANWIVKLYSTSTKTWSTVSAPIYGSSLEALYKLDYVGGGKNIAVGTLFIEYNYNHGTSGDFTADFKIWRRKATGATTISIVAATTTVAAGDSTFTIRETLKSTNEWSGDYTVTIPASGTDSVASLIPAAISAAGLTNISATYNATTGILSISHALGGDFELTDGDRSPLSVVGFGVDTENLYAAPANEGYDFIASNWKPLGYKASATAPYTDPADGTLWYNSTYDVDIMYHDGTTWVGYLNAFPGTDPAGPMVRATEPKNGDRSDGNDLVSGDIWISTANPERFGKDIYVWDNNDKVWVAQDPADDTSPTGWKFADARWATTGQSKDPSTIKALLSSDYLDPDAPDPANYPRGTRLWNTRRSGNNVKKYVKTQINIDANNGLNLRYENDVMNASGNEYFAGRWVTQDGTNADGSGKFGRHAQRGVVTAAIKSMIDGNLSVRDTDTLVLNLIAAPGYPEAIQNMINLNTDRGLTAFVVGDSPFRLAANATDLTAWGSNTANAADNGDDGLTSYDEYTGVFYPSGLTTNASGKNIVVPPSHMMLRTIINSDAKSYPWFAPAGTRRGGVDNANSVGYIDSASGEFKTVALYEGLRNVLHDVKVNPIATLPGVGVVNFGQYTRSRNASALDRINVARLVGYLRRQLAILAKPYLFEPNDAQTRREIKAAADSLLLELVGQRALYDFITVCDSSNNTAARIDKNELWMDIAIEPVKAVEFIYIPLRIKNTGEIAAGV